MIICAALGMSAIAIWLTHVLFDYMDAGEALDVEWTEDDL